MHLWDVYGPKYPLHNRLCPIFGGPGPSTRPPKWSEAENFEKSRYSHLHTPGELGPETCANRFSTHENLKNVLGAFGLILRLDKVMNRPKSEK